MNLRALSLVVIVRVFVYHALGGSLAPAAAGQPEPTRHWACIPSVIRADGVESFRIEVTVNSGATDVSLGELSGFVDLGAPTSLDINDDGTGADRVAGDGVFTAGPFVYDTDMSFPDYFARDPSSPSGLFQASVVEVRWTDETGASAQFLLPPTVGLLRSELPVVRRIVPDANRSLSPHVLNLRTTGSPVQRTLRGLENALPGLTRQALGSIADRVDFLVFLSVDKVELVPSGAAQNFQAGRHLRVQTEFTGTALPVMDDSAAYGSSGSLLGINVLDGLGRGVRSANATRELLRHWSAYVPDTLLSLDGSYRPQSSAASLVGGFRWVRNRDGTYTRDCDVGRNGAYRAPPIDLYFMGLIEAADVAPIMLSDPDEPLECGATVTGPIIEVGIDTIMGSYGERLPRPAQAQRDFRIAFVVASEDRLLNKTELTFYDRLAEHYVSAVPPGDADPYLGDNWASIDRFFGESVRGRTELPLIDDADTDQDVDRDDFAVLAGCVDGPAARARVECTPWDRDEDGRVSLADVALFALFFTGSDWP